MTGQIIPLRPVFDETTVRLLCHLAVPEGRDGDITAVLDATIDGRPLTDAERSLLVAARSADLREAADRQDQFLADLDRHQTALDVLEEHVLGVMEADGVTFAEAVARVPEASRERLRGALAAVTDRDGRILPAPRLDDYCPR